MLTCLIRTGLLPKVIQLPNAIDISREEDEALIRLCMKLLISIIFKGQSSSEKPLFQFSSNIAMPQRYQSIFEQTGIQDPGEVRHIMSQFQ